MNARYFAQKIEASAFRKLNQKKTSFNLKKKTEKQKSKKNTFVIICKATPEI
jgi:hypothetical protein